MLGVVPSGLEANSVGGVNKKRCGQGKVAHEAPSGPDVLPELVSSFGTHETSTLSDGSLRHAEPQDTTMRQKSCGRSSSLKRRAQPQEHCVNQDASLDAAPPAPAAHPYMLAAGAVHSIPLLCDTKTAEARTPAYQHVSMGMIGNNMAPTGLSATPATSTSEPARLSSVSCPLAAYGDAPEAQPLAPAPAPAPDVQLEVADLPAPETPPPAVPAAAGVGSNMHLNLADLFEVIPDDLSEGSPGHWLISTTASSIINNGLLPWAPDAATAVAPAAGAAPGGWANLENLLPILQAMPSVDEFCQMMDAEDEAKNAANHGWMTSRPYSMNPHQHISYEQQQQTPVTASWTSFNM